MQTNFEKEAQRILDVARTRRSLAWTTDRISVVADFRSRHWQYDVGTMAARHAYGRPADVLPALAQLLQEEST